MPLLEYGPIDHGVDRLGAPEKEYETHFAALTISGPPGSGTSVTSELLTPLYGIQKPIFHAGEIMRAAERARSGQEIVGGHDRNPSEDIALDELIEEEILSASTESPAIIEAHLGGWDAKKIEDRTGQRDPKVFRILLTATLSERARRIQKREEEKGVKLSIDQIKRLTRAREKKNREIWSKAHSELKGIDPHDARKNVDEKGETLYHLVIDNTNMSIEEVIERINKELLDCGLIEKTA